MQVIKLEYGIEDIGDVFAELSVEPVAAASLAQVYKGKLLTGETVAVKV
jgi:aarF domain-containing kinase